MKGILLAGGNGTRLYPLTNVASKHLMCVYDKPMIYYPLSTLMLAGIQEIMLISTPHDIELYKKLLGDGSHLGISIIYQVQEKPAGIAQAFLLAEEFIGEDNVCLILGDNIFYGDGFSTIVKQCAQVDEGAIVFGYRVNDPERYGVVEFDENFMVKSLEEKPVAPKSNYAVPGIYFYDNNVIEIAKNLKPSARGELEITDVNIEYLKQNELKVNIIGRGSAWLDTGTPQSLLAASNYVGTIEQRQGYKIACIEEIAYRMGYITLSELENSIQCMPNSTYQLYVKQLIQSELRKSPILV
ncbi:glucose-1-phosphate thymidylyltransferase [Bacillus cereus ATCC 4342]|uniref:glucose-1-phosphate thymidylyltransferase RfbA n=1 Tax=Bacillus tropicus TaxID=2026188 RepID=UPI0001A01738|nr:glucose-1-phosphate thymidylyltransferase RfbA [Bacillus tropicus]AJH75300.1 glucose-1-phosphate thymidylyltransferase [Bacillus cereus ATCC 4342]EEK85606.1 Glucose-1-phosphate thymidylyltransferase [Bacillus cereus ATCC 4342]KFM88875.1 glucose-1-phosphate thymidylyltransferase [Bacillus cereus ATCC 4342]MDR4453924.1 glucose-1-phosphate thymidylyltransferase RfbA [Bacillus tropicus]QKH54205.1 glucose-1-phosphate thymidylyltransferase RfbA [Bacillus tropicus]